jgi:hypothetical protein
MGRRRRLQRLEVSDREDPFAAIIRCTADPGKADKRTRSRWSRLMRYAAAYKPNSEQLERFVKREGGINECAVRFARCFGSNSVAYGAYASGVDGARCRCAPVEPPTTSGPCGAAPIAVSLASRCAAPLSAAVVRPITRANLAISPLAHIAKPPRCIYKRRVVARTREDLHDDVLFADRARAFEAGCPRHFLTALSDSIDRAGSPIPNSR